VGKNCAGVVYIDVNMVIGLSFFVSYTKSCWPSLTAIFNIIGGVVFFVFYFTSCWVWNGSQTQGYIRFGLATKPNDVEFGKAVRLILNK